MASGNLNFTLPLLNVRSRGGWNVPFSLTYNSQVWRYNSNASWVDGKDVGYGWGWKFLAGAITPIWNNSQLDHYLFTDSTGAEYSLYTGTDGLYRSNEGIYLVYDSSANRIYMPDGSIWSMASISAAGEPDAGSYYPTLMQDSNGNQIQILYNQGSGGSGSNTSGRIYQILDPRSAAVVSYSFMWDSGRLSAIYSITGTPESYTFQYSSSQTLNSPFSGQSAGTVIELSAVSTYGLGVSHQFQYLAQNGGTTGELTQVALPFGGVLSYDYGSYTFGTGIGEREVAHRYLLPQPGGTQYQWNLFYGSDNPSDPVHNWGWLRDVGSQTQKKWWFSTAADGYMQLATAYQEAYDGTNGNAVTESKQYTWTQANGNTYTSAVTSTLDPGTAYAAQSKTEQTLDAYGNLQQLRQYDYGNLTTPARTYNFQYLTDSNHVNRYIRNRLTSASVTGASGTVTLVTKTYEGTLQGSPSLSLHDSTYDTSFTYRGNPASVNNLGDVRNYTYDIAGNVVSMSDGSGVSVSITPSSSTDYSLPGVITPGGTSSLATSLTYTGAWTVSSVSSPNGATATTAYDVYGRPTSSTVPDGAQTTYAYTYYPQANTQTATLGSRWKRTTLDGLGRTTRVETGHDSTTVSVVETQYGPCACSPFGKVTQVSQPHAPNASVYWTVYTYDASGRTLTVRLPDGASTTHYTYQGNRTTVTDPAGKWKTFTSDAFGNLAGVAEPDPNGGANLIATYTYNMVNQLTQVTMQ